MKRGWLAAFRVATLAAAGCGSPCAVDDTERVVQGLASSSPERQRAAADIVPRLGTVPPEAVGPLLAMLEADDVECRRSAARALTYLDGGDSSLVDRLLAILGSEKDGVVQDEIRTVLEARGVVFDAQK
jgi:HEAT repeat protein